MPMSFITLIAWKYSFYNIQFLQKYLSVDVFNLKMILKLPWIYGTEDFINTKMHNCEIICNNEVALLINLQFLQYPTDTERVLFLITHVLQYIIYFNLAPNFCVGSDCHWWTCFSWRKRGWWGIDFDLVILINWL